MGFFSSLFGGDQAKAAKKAAATVNRAENANKAASTAVQTQGLEDLDAYLAQALGRLDEGQEGAVGALSPYAEAGTSSLSQIMALMGLSGPEAQAAAREGFKTDPGYQFRLSEGVNALDRSATARGGLYSGAAMKALSDYGQNTASAEYDNYFGRLSDLATSGQNAATNISSTLSSFAKDRANALLGTGQNKAQFRLSSQTPINAANSAAAGATATGIKQAADAKAAGAGNLLSIIAGAPKVISGYQNLFA